MPKVTQAIEEDHHEFYKVGIQDQGLFRILIRRGSVQPLIRE